MPDEAEPQRCHVLGPGRGDGRGSGRCGGGRGGPGDRGGVDEFDPVKTSRVQKLYWANRKKAMGQALGGQHGFYTVDRAEHYRGGLRGM